ncbi:hypothetical protein HZY93_07740 [Streptococcus danieliae]|uniref:Uncharacterized protein n=1 Tax=Streptococcus danieliae TaxID=747656 RepID=A0A7Z0LEE0_9STRE|nr:hypothetical protein [Streptococcus danieliae]MBF0717900.1 hypothetical protein [Streptococcus danieliae]NYS49830.1 hypothetical protein [Streptococcus danieliae]
MKKFLIVLSLFLVFIGTIYIYIQYNLARYSVYYASRMPRKEGTRPELVMAVENGGLIDNPQNNHVYFEEEREHTLYIGNNAYFKSNFDGYYLRVGKQNAIYFYHTDLTGNFVNYSSIVGNKNEEPLNKEMLQEIETILAPATQDLIKAQKTPSINLQILFNQKYESRFHE